MLCPSCGYDNIEGTDRCEECLTSLFNLDESQGGKRTLARSVMEDDLSKLENEFLGVTPDTATGEVVNQMKQARLGCALVLDNGKLVGIFTERDLLSKLTGPAAQSPTTPVNQLMSANPEVLLETDSIAAALNKMSMGHYRHIPVQKSDGSYCVTSIKHVLKYLAQSQW
ncbi:MAG TPA: CBS domain-containing protein [Pyrinomonadaceae bacterium]|jgi:signal-transduction protein with cAMP-binding, CBS, and nucleotidyltransferase domain|nr:CBS domain-containing protein [Pyrinomonadaceae bacterium]